MNDMLFGRVSCWRGPGSLVLQLLILETINPNVVHLGLARLAIFNISIA